MRPQFAQPDLDLLAYAEMQGFDEIAAQINIIRRGEETFHRIPQHGVIILVYISRLIKNDRIFSC